MDVHNQNLYVLEKKLNTYNFQKKKLEEDLENGTHSDCQSNY